MGDQNNGTKDPEASIILPTYNRSHIINRAVKSVIHQSFEDFELIIVDDASEDETKSIVSEFRDERINYRSHQENRGGSAARNTGIKHAEGKYVFFIDSDDEWHPTKLERQINCIRSRSEEWVAVYCLVDQDLRLSRQIRSQLRSLLPIGSPVKKGIEGDEEVIRDLLMMNFQLGGASTLGVKRDVIEDVDGFDETFERHQDWEFLIRVLQHGKLACVQEPLVIKHDSGSPNAQVYEQAKTQYINKFSDLIEKYEGEGHDITTIHKHNLAKRYIRDGNIITGMNYAPLLDMSFFQYLSLLWAISEGVINHGAQIIKS
jgi:glycosyltransferase involved in cell wall biosynthesis